MISAAYGETVRGDRFDAVGDFFVATTFHAGQRVSHQGAAIDSTSILFRTVNGQEPGASDRFVTSAVGPERQSRDDPTADRP